MTAPDRSTGQAARVLLPTRDGGGRWVSCTVVARYDRRVYAPGQPRAPMARVLVDGVELDVSAERVEVLP